MAKQKLNDLKLTIGGTTYSTEGASCVVNYEAEELDTTCYGDTARRREGGLKNGSLNITFKVNDDLSGLFTAIWNAVGTVIAFTAKASTATTAASEPEVQGSVLITQAIPFGGDVGGLFEQSVSWPIDDDLTLATS